MRGNSPSWAVLGAAGLCLAALVFLGRHLKAGDDHAMAVKTIQSRVQRLFDRALKLSRGHKDPRALRITLIELSSYHGEEQAEYASRLSGAPKVLVDIGPWALWHLAELELSQGEHEQAAGHFLQLQRAYEARSFDEPSGGEDEIHEPAELAGLRGQARTLNSFLKKGRSTPVEKQLLEVLRQVQKKHGSREMACARPCGSYGSWALGQLWEYLGASQADSKQWEAATLKHLKLEKNPQAKAAVLMALSRGYARLGQAKDAARLEKSALKSSSQALTLDFPAGAFSNLK